MPAAEKSGFPDQILNDPRIVGVDLGGTWGTDIETIPGVYDWSSIDTEVAKAESHGKKILLRIVAGGVNVPDWLLSNPNVQTFSFIDQNTYHSTYGQELTMPVFWDPIFLQKKMALLAAAGAHFAGHASIVVVACSFANASTGDWGIPSTPDDITNWRAAGYTTDKMVNTGKMAVDATMAAFPNQNVALSIGRGAGDLDPTQDYLAETVVNYATQTYGRFISEKNSLSATTRDPVVSSSNLLNWQVLFDQSPVVAGQMLWYVTDDTTYRMNAGAPANAAAVLLQSVTTGVHYGTQYQEIYESDLKNPAMSSVIDAANTLLTAHTNPPAAPDNAKATSDSLTAASLTWRDNSNNELGFRIEMKDGTNGTYEVLTTVGPNLTSATMNNLIEGAQYYYRVQAINAGGVSAYSNETTATTTLKAPGGLTAQPVSSSKVLLTWADHSATEDGFTIERSAVTDTQFNAIATVGANVTSFTDSNLDESTKYWYRVRAFNATATSAYSAEKQATTLHDLPGTPSKLAVTSFKSNTISLSWLDNSDNESGFKLQRKKTAAGTFTDIKTTAANITAYTDRDSTLLDGTPYFYRTCATNSAGDSAFSSETSATTTLNAPNTLAGQAISSSQTSLTWVDHSASEDGFTIERSASTNTNYQAITTVSANVSSYTDSSLSGATKYWYRVRAFNSHATSSYSNEKQITTLNNQPTAPSAVTLSALLSNKITVSWSDNSNDESGFKIQRKTGTDGTFADIKTTAANITSYTDQDGSLQDGLSYSYRVCSTNSAGDSAFSNVATGTTMLLSPTSLTTDATSASQAKLTWSDRSATEDGFTIERRLDTDSTYHAIATVGPNVTTYTDSGLTGATKYWYRVRAFNANATSDYSNEKQVTTLNDLPAVPSAVTVTSLQTNTVSLSWNDNSDNESGFKIQRKKGASGTFLDIKTTAANVAIYTDRDAVLTDGTTYFYRVCATNSAGDSAYSDEISATTLLAKPTSASASALSSSRIDLTWLDNSSSESGYKIERKTTATGTYAQIALVGANAKSYSDTTGLVANTRYYYRVRATNGTIDSDYSNEPSAVTLR